MSGHTPGPWRIKTTGNIGNAIEADCGLRSPLFADNGFRTVATFQSCCASDRYDEQEANALANARLIAAAPELLEQAEHNKRARDAVDRLLSDAGYQDDSSVRNLLACMNFDAIARATGEGNEPAL